MSKTPEYTKKAISNYRDKFDVMQIRLPKGTRDRISALTDMSHNEFISKAVVKEIERLENE